MGRRRFFGLKVWLLWAAVCIAPAAHAGDERARGPREPGPPQTGRIAAMVRRMDRAFVALAVDGITLDSRFDINPPEAIRQSVVCQLLGYAELQALLPRERFRRTIARDADYLLEHLAEIRSHTPFDGMLGYSLLLAWEVTRDPRHLAAARAVVDEMRAIPVGTCLMNGGFMVAMALAKDAQLFGDAAEAQQARAILTLNAPYQNADGSWPHWCIGSRDIHYTGWMAHELVHLERMLDDPRIGGMLARMNAFMEARVGPDGKSRYVEPCPGVPGCEQAYYSRATGCAFDYDTRGWTVEPGYQVLLFDHMRSAREPDVLHFLDSLERGGTLPDLYDYWPPPDDPEYPWTIADTSMANTSIVFWSLATALRDRGDVREARVAWGEEPAPVAPPVGGPGREPFSGPMPPLPAGDPGAGGTGPEMRFVLAAAAEVEVRVHDASGRIVRRFDAGWRAPGVQSVRWDTCDDAGKAAASGVYFAIIRAGQERWSRRCVVLR